MITVADANEAKKVLLGRNDVRSVNVAFINSEFRLEVRTWGDRPLPIKEVNGIPVVSS